MSPEKKSTKFSSLSTAKRQVLTELIVGFIALKDLRKVAKELGELTDDNTLQEMMDRADIDQDGTISEEEFYNLLTKKAYWFDLIHKLNFIHYFCFLKAHKRLFKNKNSFFQIKRLLSVKIGFNLLFNQIIF